MSFALPVVSDAEGASSLEEPTVPRILLVGNPNSGKTSLFNSLSGLRARTANYPGITVELRQADISVGGPGRTQSVRLIDLPGLYGLEPTSPEEKLAAASIRSESEPSVELIVLVMDASNLARSLFLAEEVLATGKPALVALNMIDVAKSEGVQIEHAELAKQLECLVVPVSARTGEGLKELKETISNLVSNQRINNVSPRLSCTVGCSGCGFANRHEWTRRICESTVRGGSTAQAPVGRLDQWLTSAVAGTICLLAVLFTVFYCIFSLAGFPMSLIENVFGWLSEMAERLLPSEALSETVGGLIWRPAAFVLSLATFAMSYRLSDIKLTRRSCAAAIGASILVCVLPLGDFRSLVIDGVIGGVAGVVVFLPQICILFFFIALLEDTGYLARAAFVMERWMRRVGLPGKAFVPMLSAHACAIPGIMATRTIENWRDRLVTILVLPLLTCSARLPVYAMMAALLFPGQPTYAALVFAAAYLLGLAAALGSAWVLKKTILPGETAPLVIELPRYRLPSLRNAMMSALDRATAFLKTAGSAILLISVLLWAMATYPKPPAADIVAANSSTSSLDDDPTDEYLASQAALEYSIAGRLGRTLEPVFDPLGFDWRINVGVVTSFAAREVVVSTLSVLYGIGEEGAEDNAGLVETLRSQRRADGSPVFSFATSCSLLVFFVLAMQCLPTQAVTKRETGQWKWAILQFVFMTLLAYAAALMTYQTLRLIT